MLFQNHDAFLKHKENIEEYDNHYAEKIVERLFYLGEVTTTKPAPISLGENLKEILENDRKAEEETIEFYKRIITQAQINNDVTTTFIFQEILEDEEEHHDTFQSLLEADESI